jgi:hypothetical protein
MRGARHEQEASDSMKFPSSDFLLQQQQQQHSYGTAALCWFVPFLWVVAITLVHDDDIAFSSRKVHQHSCVSLLRYHDCTALAAAAARPLSSCE